MVAEAALELSRQYERQERAQEVRTPAIEAMRAAIRSDHQEVLGAALLLLGRVELRDGEVARAEAMVTLADASVQRLGAPADATARVSALRGLVAANAGRIDEAERELRAAARELEEADLGRESRAAWINLATALTDAGRGREGYALYREVAERASEELGVDHPELALLEFNSGVAALELGEVPKALAHLERARSLSEQGFGMGSVPVSSALLALGVAAQMHGDWSAAWEHASALGKLAAAPTYDPVAGGPESVAHQANAAAAVCLANVAQDRYVDLLRLADVRDAEDAGRILVGNLELAYHHERLSELSCGAARPAPGTCALAEAWAIAADASALALRGLLDGAPSSAQAFSGPRGHLERFFGRRALARRDFEAAVRHLNAAVEHWVGHGGEAQPWVVPLTQLELALALVGKVGARRAKHDPRIEALMEVALADLLHHTPIGCPDAYVPLAFLFDLDGLLGERAAKVANDTLKRARTRSWSMKPVTARTRFAEHVVAFVKVDRGEERPWPRLREVRKGEHGWRDRCPKPGQSWYGGSEPSHSWVQTQLSEPSIARCGGVVVEADLVLTSRHCLNEGHQGLLLTRGYVAGNAEMPPSTGADTYEVVEAYADPKNSADWILLKVAKQGAPSGMPGPWSSWVPWSNTAEPGRLWSLGFPLGVPMQESKGALASGGPLGEHPVHTTLSALEFSSGSPVFDEHGLLGVVDGGEGTLNCDTECVRIARGRTVRVFPVRQDMLNPSAMDTYRPKPGAKGWQKRVGRDWIDAPQFPRPATSEAQRDR